jgi:excisionase family DNA binding protein
MNELSTSRLSPVGDSRLAVSPAEAARLAGIGRTTLYEALGSGALRSLKIGKRRLITIEALKDWLTAAERTGQVEGGNER